MVEEEYSECFEETVLKMVWPLVVIVVVCTISSLSSLSGSHHGPEVAVQQAVPQRQVIFSLPFLSRGAFLGVCTSFFGHLGFFPHDGSLLRL